MEFEDTREAREYLREWQHRLYLDDWIIKLYLIEPSEDPENQGTVEIDSIHRCAIVRIAKYDKTANDYIIRLCHEQTLVHELMHCKLDLVDNHDCSDTAEGKCYDGHMHNIIDTMARSLIMAKYGIGPEWFNNVPEAE
jgi:hypothetical protein